MTVKHDIWKKISEMIIDLILVISSFAIAYYIRLNLLYFIFNPENLNSNNTINYDLWTFFLPWIYISPVFIILFAWSGLYSFRWKSAWEKLRIISMSSLAGVMFYVLIFFFYRELFFSRLIILMVFVISVLFVWGFHLLAFEVNRKKWLNGKNISRVLIIGANKAALRAIEEMRKNYSPLYPVAILAPYGSKKKIINDIPVVGKLDALEKTVKEYKINSIHQADAVEQSLNLLTFAEGNFIDYRISPEILGAFHHNMITEEIKDFSTLYFQASPLFGWGQFFKRLFDIIFSFILILILLPFFTITYIFRKILKPREKVFTKVKRARGFSGNFFMYHFYINKNNKWGRFLKNNFLRDFPAIFNVLKGDMSFVGPRPAKIEDRENMPLHFRRRHIFKPGLTGLWQLERLKGKSKDDDEMIRLDVKYIHSWSFFKDIKIIGKTCLLIIQKLFMRN